MRLQDPVISFVLYITSSTIRCTSTLFVPQDMTCGLFWSASQSAFWFISQGTDQEESYFKGCLNRTISFQHTETFASPTNISLF